MHDVQSGMVSATARLGALLCIAVSVSACAARSPARQRLAYTPAEFRREVARRAPDLDPESVRVPFELSGEIVERARQVVSLAGRPGPSVLALIDFVSDAPPRGLGLQYEWRATQSARDTLRLGRGNCVSLASVLVGLGRGLGWQIHYGEARSPNPELLLEDDIAIRRHHMVVVVRLEGVRAVVDFAGIFESRHSAHPIDDISAYAHIINNRASQLILAAKREGVAPPWERALEGYRLAAQLQPEFASAWSNEGVALARLGRLEEARVAYARAHSVDPSLEAVTLRELPDEDAR
jgi:tetratricopeptide (TPR) repeat protein